MSFVRWLRTVRPGEALKWVGVALAYAIAILFVINVIWATIDQHS